jgi:hypothetical protein
LNVLFEASTLKVVGAGFDVNDIKPTIAKANNKTNFFILIKCYRCD